MPRHPGTPPRSQNGSVSTPSSHEEDPSSGSESEEVIDPKERRKQIKQALVKIQVRKRQSCTALQPYIQFAQWHTRNGQLTVDWHLALVKGIANDNHDYGKFKDRNAFKKRYENEISAYIDLKNEVRVFEEDMKYIEKHPKALSNLANVMIAASGSAKSNNISGLKSPVLNYTALIHENLRLEPQILPTDRKNTSRGFNHIQLARLLCPAKLLIEFDKNPEEFRRELASGRQKARSNDMPAFIWNRNEYDPEHISSNMFRSEVLLMTYRHIFTSPSSATKEPGSTKTKGSQAKKNHLKSVTPESIAYTCVQYRYAISSVEDWRLDDQIFDRQQFFNQILDIFLEERASDPDWYFETIQWWNLRVFGTELDCIDDSENEEGPSTLRAIREQREAAKMMSQAAAYKLPPPDPNRPRSEPSSPFPPPSPRLPTPDPPHNPSTSRAANCSHDDRDEWNGAPNTQQRQCSVDWDCRPASPFERDTSRRQAQQTHEERHDLNKRMGQDLEKRDHGRYQAQQTHSFPPRSHEEFQTGSPTPPYKVHHGVRIILSPNHDNDGEITHPQRQPVTTAKHYLDDNPTGARVSPARKRQHVSVGSENRPPQHDTTRSTPSRPRQNFATPSTASGSLRQSERQRG